MVELKLILLLSNAVLGILISGCIKSGYSSLLLPEQFHCTSELFFFHRTLKFGDTFFIDEYVDRPNQRSSLRLKNENGVDLIYYNELFGDHADERSIIARQFVQYNPNKLTCARQDLYGWYLDQVRKIAISILPMDQVTSKNVDIAMGSSGLLYAIESRMDELQFRGIIFDKSRLISVHVFELSIMKPFGVAYDLAKDLLIQVRVMSPGDAVIGNDIGIGQPATSLADFFKQNQSKQQLTIVGIRVCSVSAAKVRRTTKLLKPYECQNDYIDGSEQDLIASIDLIENLISDSLIGQPVEKIGQFDYELNPFAQPVGVGCGQKSRAMQQQQQTNEDSPTNKRIKKRMTFEAHSDQFSAEYFTVNGLKGLSFVAFDGQRQVMRHDRDGRKNIYDLRQGRSYHVDKFHSVQSMFDNSQATNCVELDIGDDMFLIDDSISPMARLIGIDSIDGANYIGSKTIDDETFAVYELELEQNKNSLNSFNLPIVMEPIDFVMPFVSASGGGSGKINGSGNANKRETRYFMTYYVLEILKINGDGGGGGGDDQSNYYDIVKIPRFVELWELRVDDEGNRERSLINMLEFTQFSWSLNIEPEEEEADEATREVGGDLSRLFSIDSCAQERSQQLLLTFHTIYSNLPASLVQINRQLIREKFHEQLANILDIPRLNLISLDFQFNPPYTGMWLVKAKIVELVRGISQDKLLGYLQFSRSSKWLTASELSKADNRHSYDQCKLDSLALKKPNSIVYCPGLTSCLLIDTDILEEHRGDLYEKEQANKIRSSDFNDAICEVHQFSWRPIPTSSQNDERAILPRVLENRNRIMSTNFVIDLMEPIETIERGSQKVKKLRVRYQGFGHGVKVRLVDDTIGRQKSPLTGLRYLTASEESKQTPGGDSETTNSNYAYKLRQRDSTAAATSSSSLLFRQCHMACQMDEFCQSFSICNQGKVMTDSNNDIMSLSCILSTMRLTRNKIADLAEIIRSTKKVHSGEDDEDDDEISIEVDTGIPSFSTGDHTNHLESYKFRKQQGCSLHPKDILAQFRPIKSLDLPIDLDSTDRDLMQNTGADVVSLDECAGIANEAAVLEEQQNSLEAHFVYCPLESLCLSSEQSLKAKTNQTTNLSEEESSNNSTTTTTSNGQDKIETCFVYEKSHYMNFYDYILFHKVSLKFNETSIKLEDDYVQNIGRTIEGLSPEQCARDCNLQQSNCLAFDLCEFETNVTICTLYSIRSPLASKTKAGFLPQERLFYGESNTTQRLNSATLVENGKCAHFKLQDTYFEIKIHHLLEADSRLKRDRLNKLEDKILEFDVKASDAMMIYSILGLPNKTTAESNQQQQQDHVKESSSGNDGGGLMIHLLLIISSGILGALGYLYSGEAYTFTSDTIEYLRATRGQRFANHRISQLNLPNNLDL